MVLYCVLGKHSHMFSDKQYNQSSILFEPPKKLNLMFYRCENKFTLDPILEMFEDDENYGLCLISGEELFVYITTVSGDRIDYKIVNKKTIELETRSSRGGSSAGRYGRINDKAKAFNKTTFSEMIVNSYMTENHTKCRIKKLIIAGPTDMKRDISETPLFQQHLKKYLFKSVNTNGIHDTTAMEVMEQFLIDIKYSNIKDVDNDIDSLIQYKYEMLTIGRNECMQFIDKKNIIKLYVCKSMILGDTETMDMIDKARKNIINLSVIYSESSTLKTYGGWLGVKKYNEIEIVNEIE